MEKMTVYLPADLGRALKELARPSGRSQAALIRDAIAAFIARQEPSGPKTFGIVSRGDVQATDVEDWLAENWMPD